MKFDSELCKAVCKLSETLASAPLNPNCDSHQRVLLLSFEINGKDPSELISAYISGEDLEVRPLLEVAAEDRSFPPALTEQQASSIRHQHRLNSRQMADQSQPQSLSMVTLSSLAGPFIAQQPDRLASVHAPLYDWTG